MYCNILYSPFELIKHLCLCGSSPDSMTQTDFHSWVVWAISNPA